MSERIVIGRDARPSGEMIAEIVTGTARAMGLDVVDLGLSTTPTVQMAVPMAGAGGGIIISASHNPTEWNALKLLNGLGELLTAVEGEQVLGQVGQPGFVTSDRLGGRAPKEDAIQKHIDAICNLPLVDVEGISKKEFNVVVDAVNSTGGLAVPLLLEALGVQLLKIHCTPNGDFPHNPEPLPENITEICEVVRSGKYDLGIVVDPDVDRLALVAEDGSPFGEEYTLVAVADYVLQHTKKKVTVSNLSSTRALKDITENAGGTYYNTPVGEAHVVAKMKECGAVIGGEGNGGVIYPDLHYGRDALVGIALFLSHLATTGLTASQLRREYPAYVIAKRKMELASTADVDAILKNVRNKYNGARADTRDGLKLDFDHEWIHLRKSNTEPIIRIFAEATTVDKANHLAQTVMDEIRKAVE